MAFANAQHHNKDVVIIDGVHKGTAVRTASDVPPGSSLRVSNCHDAVIYLLAPAEYATVTQARSVSHWSPYDRVRRGERRSLRTFSPGASLRPSPLAFNPRPSTPFNSV